MKNSDFRKDILLNQELITIYEDWIKENPYDKGQGWGKTPWSQKEMPLTDQMVSIAKASDVALVIIGRTAGEDQDNLNNEGSYLLTQTERDLIETVSKSCERTVVLLNVGNAIDMNWIDEFSPAAVMYVWQGGQEGGNGTVDVLMGDVTPCGKLPVTIARDISDHLSDKYFGDPKKNYYAEDIYVGYRYFETVAEAKDKVLFPFGYGISYTLFDMSGKILRVDEKEIDKFAVYFYADDLKFFARSGRVSGFSGVMGNLLGIHPIIHMSSEGKMVNLAKARGKRNSLNKIIDMVSEIEEDIANYPVIIAHSDCLEIAHELEKLMKERFGENLKTEYVVVNPTAGAHCGPNCVGVAFHAKHR